MPSLLTESAGFHSLFIGTCSQCLCVNTLISFSLGFSISPCFNDCNHVTGLQAIFASLIRNSTNSLKEGNLLLFSSTFMTFRFHLAVSQSGHFNSIFLFSLQSFRISNALMWSIVALQLLRKSTNSELKALLSADPGPCLEFVSVCLCNCKWVSISFLQNACVYPMQTQADSVPSRI